MTVPQLFPAQEEGVRRFLASGGRYLFAYGTGVGKTPTAIVALTRHLALLGRQKPKILVVCPAIVRRHWVAEFERWGGLKAHPVEMGARRATGSKRALAARDAAYAADIQIVSYDLLPEVRAQGWDGVVFDEVHHLADYGSKQSVTARGLMLANPGVPTIGLSATLIPTRLHQLWHPLHLLWPGAWGRAPRSGSIPWQFVSQWQHIEDDGYGKYPGLAREERLNELKARLGEVSHRLTREDIAGDLPAVDARPLEIPGQALGGPSGTSRSVKAHVEASIRWLEALPPDIHHAVILCYHRDVAIEILAGVFAHLEGGSEWTVIPISGESSTAARVGMLGEAERAKRCIVVATSEAIREGIRLMWAQRVLYAEWRQSPKQVIQTLGRFTSVADARRPQIDVLTDESLRDRARLLMQRIGDNNQVFKPGSTENKVADVFKPEELTADAMREATKAMFAQRATALDPEWGEVDLGDDDDGW